MNNSRTVLSKGFLFNDNQAATRLSSTQQQWKFVPLAKKCAQCCACGQVNMEIDMGMDMDMDMNIKKIMTAQILDETHVAELAIPVYLAILDKTIPTILWHSLLLPLAGFILGALAGYSLLHNDAAAVAGSMAGLVLAALFTHSLQGSNLVSIETTRDFKTLEIIN